MKYRVFVTVLLAQYIFLSTLLFLYCALRDDVTHDDLLYVRVINSSHNGFLPGSPRNLIHCVNFVVARLPSLVGYDKM